MFFITSGHYWIDPLLTLLIALIIFYSGWEIVQHTVPILVDEAWIREEEVSKIILSTANVIGYHNFRSRKVHDHAFVELSVKFDTDSLQKAHGLSHEIEQKIIEKFGKAKITIHIEPS